MIRFLIAFAACLMVAFGVCVLAVSHGLLPRPISGKLVDQEFQYIAKESHWDMSGPVLWGYYFISPNRGRLETAGGILSVFGYRRVEVRRDDTGLWTLHVEKVERHTPRSLKGRNWLLYLFAIGCGLSAYDGMDVGPAPVPSMQGK